MKKILAMVLSVAIIATIALTGTVAYLTNQDSKVNQADVGSVFVEQYEKIRDADNQLINFVDDKQVVPAVYGTVFARGNYKLESEEEISLPALTGNNSVKNYQDKIVYAKNTGTAPAYMRTIIGVPAGSYQTWLHLDFNKGTGVKWIVPTDKTATAKIDEKEYDLYVLNYSETVAGGAFTDANLLGFYIDKDVNNEKDEAGSIYYTFNGKSIGDISKLKIYVATQAVQSEGFGSITDAFAATYKDITATNHPWAPKVVKGNTDELKSQLEALRTATENKTITLTENAVYDFNGVEWTSISNNNAVEITIDGNGATLKNMKAPLFGDVLAKKLTIKDLTIDKAEMNNIAETDNVGTSYGAFIQFFDNKNQNLVVTLDNCHLTNSTIKSVQVGEEKKKLGKYVGGLIGYASDVANNVEFKNCSVENCEIQGNGTIGGLIGVRQGPLTVTDSSVKGCELTSSNTEEWRVGTIIGTLNLGSTATLSNCTSTENTLTQDNGNVTPTIGQSDLCGRNAAGEDAITISPSVI